jgi:hypothetical protein
MEDIKMTIASTQDFNNHRLVTIERGPGRFWAVSLDLRTGAILTAMADGNVAICAGELGHDIFPSDVGEVDSRMADLLHISVEEWKVARGLAFITTLGDTPAFLGL